jgi:hypothetical protein
MIERLENKFTQMKGSNEEVKEYSVVVDTIPNMKLKASDFDGKLIEIAKKDADRKTAMKGKTADKRDAFGELVDGTLKVSSGLYLYGKDTNKNDLIEIGSLRKSYLDKQRDTEVDILVQPILTAGNANAADLAAYGVTDAMLIDLKAKLLAYNTSLEKKEGAMGNQTGMRKSLTLLFKEADDIQDSLDGYMEILRTDHQEFYDVYMASRVIRNLGEKKYKKKEPPVPPVPPTP